MKKRYLMRTLPALLLITLMFFPVLTASANAEWFWGKRTLVVRVGANLVDNSCYEQVQDRVCRLGVCWDVGGEYQRPCQ